MSGKKIGTALHPLVQLLPAAVLAAVLLVTLPGTVPVLAEVPQRLEMAAVEETPTAYTPVLPAGTAARCRCR